MIGDKGCRYLASAQWVNLKELDLSNDCLLGKNYFGDQGCKYLVSAKWRSLKEIKLCKNNEI